MGSKAWALLVCGVLHALLPVASAFEGIFWSPPVRLTIYDRHVVLDNGILHLNLTKPHGNIAGIRYNGVDNLLEHRFPDDRRGYWDVSWDDPQGIRNGTNGWQIRGIKFRVILEDEEQVEVSFTRKWGTHMNRRIPPLNVDKRYIVLRGSRGFYAYGIYEHKDKWPDLNIYETRIALKLDKKRFRYMAISDARQRMMPMPEDRLEGRAELLAFKEAVRIINPTNPMFKGEVDDKYQYSLENQDNKVHGWIASEPPLGFWMITPSNEFKIGGPLKQDLTSHTGPVTLSMFVSCHYTGDDLAIKLRNGEYWKKVFGPVFIYLNSNRGMVDATKLWRDAKLQMEREVELWPYDFPASKEFPKAHKRGSISGRLYVRDSLFPSINVHELFRFISDVDLPADTAYVGLAPLGKLGSWQNESKGYQFWTRTDGNGLFSIRNVRRGVYSFFAWVPGFIGEYRFPANIVINRGREIHLGHIFFKPPRCGPTLWEIGIPDRSAAEFYIPDPDPRYANKLYTTHPEKFRQYGLWDRYGEVYPERDLIYTVGISDWRKDWFFAQVNRRTENATRPYAGTTWQIRFHLNKVATYTTYKLRLALASVTKPNLHVRVNDPSVQPPHFTIALRAVNNAIARHGIKGMYLLFNLDIRSSWLVRGGNVIFLSQKNAMGPFEGLMYDYIRFEGPKPSDVDVR